MAFLPDLIVVDTGLPYLMFVLRTEPRALIFDGDSLPSLSTDYKTKLALEAGSI